MTPRDYFETFRTGVVAFVLFAIALPFVLAGVEWLWDSWRNR